MGVYVCGCVWGGGGDVRGGGCPGRWARGMFSAVVISIVELLFFFVIQCVCLSL